ncbi:MAG: DUF58 domain-containing protein [Actinomycetota bacterium]
MARPRLRLRSRFVGLALGSAMLFLVGTNVQSGWVFVLSALLLGVAGAGVILPFRATRGLRVVRRAAGEVFPGDAVRVDLVVSNPTRRPKLSVSVRDPHVQPATVFLPSIPPGGTVTATTGRTASRRGVVEGGTVEVVSSAPFGVAEVRRTISAGGRTVVFPRIVPVAGLALLGGPLTGASSENTGQRGPGPEFHGIREYQQGDTLRHVHWRSTARHGALIVREFEREQPAHLLVAVDTYADTAEETGDTALDVCCSAAASVALDALGRGSGVSLAAATARGMEITAGVDRGEALTMLAALRAPGDVPVAGAIDAAREAVAATALLVALPTWRSNEARILVPAIQRATGNGLRVAAVVVDVARSSRRGAPELTPAEIDELAAGLAGAGAEVHRGGSASEVAASLSRSPAGVSA